MVFWPSVFLPKMKPPKKGPKIKLGKKMPKNKILSKKKPEINKKLLAMK